MTIDGKPIREISRLDYWLELFWLRPADVPRVRR